MRRRIISLSSIFWLALASSLLAGGIWPPNTPKKPVTDTYHGIKVIDQYRWLEKTNDPEVKKWLDEQNKVTRTLLDKSPALPPLKARLKELIADPEPSYSSLLWRAGQLFALKYQPPKEQPVLITLKSADDPGSAKVVLDPTVIDSKGKTTIDFFTPSPDGKMVAVSLSEGGSEEGTLYIYEVATGKKSQDVIPRVSFPTAGGCVAWIPDGTGFYYTRYPRDGERPKEDLNFYQQVYYHKLGTPEKQDTYVFGKGLPRIAEIFIDLSEDGKYLLATVQKGDGGEFAHHLRGPNGKWTQLTKFDSKINAMAFGRGEDKCLYLLSRQDAPKGKILRLPLGETDLSRATVVAPESKVAIVGMDWHGTRMFPSHLPTASGVYVLDVAGGPSQLRFFPRDGSSAIAVPLPPVAAVNQLVPLNGDEILLHVSTYTKPPAWYRYHLGDKQLKKTALFKKSKISFEDIEVTRLVATSKDGTQVPMTVMHRKDVKLDGTNPTLLYAYGGYGVTLAPQFAGSRRIWLDQGGVYAIANLRGGGEYGDEWHKAAVLTKRQNAYDDFFACANLLIEKKYTSPKKLAIEGGSNGGLLMGVALTQHPELFRAVVAHVGIFDMLRFEQHPNGVFNTTEFGTVKNPEHFKALYAYSPLHHVKKGTAYPAVFLLTGANDGRVDPSNSYKMTAQLQAATSSKNPILLRVSFDSGHGLGDSLSAGINRSADVYAFLFEQLGMKYKEH